MYELQRNEYSKIRHLIKDIPTNPVINGVIDGHNRGRIYVDEHQIPSAAMLWAKNEMFYLIGNPNNKAFNSSVEKLIINKIKTEAISIGDDCFNLELYPYKGWEPMINFIFTNKLCIGERVPFEFDYNEYVRKTVDLNLTVPEHYQIEKIDRKLIKMDGEGIIEQEVLKFWETIDTFLEKGIGTAVINEGKIIGTCLSVFVSGTDFEIGINTYQTEHRGKGLATAMANRFIQICIERGGTPYWKTENFRKDSIAIANKLGFRQLNNYYVFYLPFNQFHA